MGIACPSCGFGIKVSQMRQHFTCPHCSTGLKANTTMPMIGGVVVWTLADFLIYPVVYSNFGTGWSAHLLRIAISGLIGFPLMFLSSVRLARWSAMTDDRGDSVAIA